MAEFPCNLLEPNTWVTLFGVAGYTEDGQPTRRPEKSVTVYRGCHPERRFGMSWTTDIDRAQWFADRDLGGGTGNVYHADINPAFLLAYVHDNHRGEAEYIVDPVALSDETFRLMRSVPAADV